jgi:hypothetical protein
MLTKKSRIIIAALSSILCFLSAVYVSCTKPGGSPSCNGVVCKNSGYCNHGHCVCPTGYESADCGTASVAKYIGAWDVTQTTVGSDSPSTIGHQSTYTMFLKTTATPTTFFIDNFLGNSSYNQMLCTLDSVSSNRFVLDSIRDQNMIFGIVYIMPNSSGSYVAASHKISSQFIIRSLTPTHIWKIDTFSLEMVPHHF